MTPVLADLSTIPSKYHVFISPPLRRVYLGGMDDSSQVVIDGLKSEITTLKGRIVTLTRDKESLSEDLLESRSTASRLASAERAARLSLDEVKEVARLGNQRLEGLRAEYDSLKSQ
jgi:chromosome segregation ATPase